MVKQNKKIYFFLSLDRSCVAPQYKGETIPPNLRIMTVEQRNETGWGWGKETPERSYIFVKKKANYSQPGGYPFYFFPIVINFLKKSPLTQPSSSLPSSAA